MLAIERGRPLVSAAIVGVAGLARETNLLVMAAQPWPRDRKAWLRAGLALTLAVVPLLLWEDYLHSIYRSTIFAGADTFMPPGVALSSRWLQALAAVRAEPLSAAWRPLCILSSLVAQGLFVIVHRRYRAAWWRVAVPYVVLMLFFNEVLADPQTAAITRVLLPLTIGFNILLAGEPRPARFWPWFIVGNLHLVVSSTVMPLLF